MINYRLFGTQEFNNFSINHLTWSIKSETYNSIKKNFELLFNQIS